MFVRVLALILVQRQESRCGCHVLIFAEQALETLAACNSGGSQLLEFLPEEIVFRELARQFGYQLPGFPFVVIA